MKEMINGSEMIECGSVVIVDECEKCANVRMLVYEMQVRLRDSLWP